MDIKLLEKTHLGEAIFREPQRRAPEDIYIDFGNVKSNRYEGFNRIRQVYGLQLIINENIEDDFVELIVETFKEMFAKREGSIGKIQEQILKSMYEHKATLPVITEEEVENIKDDMALENSICDVIFRINKRQPMEVVEHLLHAINDCGLHFAMHDDWGVDNKSRIDDIMKEAIENEYYIPLPYKEELEEDGCLNAEETLQRILIQEFSYWLITSYWNTQQQYGPHEDEWTLLTKSSLEEKLNAGYTLVRDTVEGVIDCPSPEILSKLDELNK